MPYSHGMTTKDVERIDYTLTKAISHLIAFADDTPYLDDPRWSPWTRFQKPLADRCRVAREIVRGADPTTREAKLTELERDSLVSLVAVEPN